MIFPELNSMSLSELKELSECPEKLDELIDRLPALQALDSNVDELIESTGKLASKSCF